MIFYRLSSIIKEEIDIHKKVERDTVEAVETLRQEELAIDTDNDLVIK